MRFRKAHKTTTYGVVFSAFGSVASSGLLNPLLLLVSTMAIVGSWFWEAPRVRPQRWNTAWTVLASIVFAYSLLSVLAGAEILFAGTNFLLVLLIVKLFNRTESKDYLQIYLLSFLILTAGTVLNAEITYGLFFLCFVVSSTWALTLFHLRRELENNFRVRLSQETQVNSRLERVMNSHRIVGRKFFLGTGLVSLGVFLSALGLFLLFPRVGLGFFFDKGRGGISMAGFSDGVSLGGHGLIKQDSTVVMRVKVASRYQGRKAPYLHWRGVAFDFYSKGKWSRSRLAPETRREVSSNAKTTTHHLLYSHGSQNPLELKARNDAAFKQEIYLEPVGYDVLFGASMPLAFAFENKSENKTRAGKNDELRHIRSAGIKYTVYSDPKAPAAASLRRAETTLPVRYEVFLQLPEEIPKCESENTPSSLDEVRAQCRVRDLARYITRDASTNYDKAKALEDWLRTQLEYTLLQKEPGDMEPVEFFLFSRKMGHCEYFSSAMSVMARALGIPIRNVNGFLGGEWNEYSDYIAVRAGDAHSWVEVYFGEYGWVTFDPTPSGQSDLMGRGSSGLLDRLRRMADTMRFKWFKWVIEYDLFAQLKLFRNVGKSIKGSAQKYFKAPMSSIKIWAKAHKKEAVAIVLFLGVVAIVLGLRKRREGEAPLLRSRTDKRKKTPVTTQYVAVLKTLARRGFRRTSSMTPREFASDLAASKIPGADNVQKLTELYYQVEYGEAPHDSAPRATFLRKAIVRELRETKTRNKN
ncbi:MAG: DUF3488 domain-containing protein [Kofleriaceae bacterium]|nr:DUF3488 domain-containing protein [Kofleriaceae bacterium]